MNDNTNEDTIKNSLERIVDVGKCRKCGGEMQKGIALEQNYSGQPDFIGSKDVCTISPNGTANIIYCRKCSKCGHSTA